MGWIDKTRRAKEAVAERDRLIAAGWYRADEITLKHVLLEVIPLSRQPSAFVQPLASVELEVHRSGISHHYSRIPLHIMTRYARESGIDVDSELESDENIPNTLTLIQEHIEAYITRVGTASASGRRWRTSCAASADGCPGFLLTKSERSSVASALRSLISCRTTDSFNALSCEIGRAHV